MIHLCRTIITEENPNAKTFKMLYSQEILILEFDTI